MCEDANVSSLGEKEHPHVNVEMRYIECGWARSVEPRHTGVSSVCPWCVSRQCWSVVALNVAAAVLEGTLWQGVCHGRSLSLNVVSTDWQMHA